MIINFNFTVAAGGPQHPRRARYINYEGFLYFISVFTMRNKTYLNSFVAIGEAKWVSNVNSVYVNIDQYSGWYLDNRSTINIKWKFIA